LDHHQPACDALERSTPLLLDALRRVAGTDRPTRMRWTNGEIAAHMLASLTEAHKAARGEPSLYDDGLTSALDEMMIARVPERDPKVLADMIEEGTGPFLATVRKRIGGDATIPPGTTVATHVGLLALDHHLHGGQFSQTAGSPWRGVVADMYSPLSIALPFAFDPEAARDFRGSYTLMIRGVQSLRYTIERGRLEMDTAARTDCTITADLQTFLLVGLGLVSLARAALTGKMRARGRKPWLASATPRLFPPIPHGGLAR
jgi:hypothetical protein